MISQHLAESVDHFLGVNGVPWRPQPGDRFVIPGRDLDEVFVIAQMTIEVAHTTAGAQVYFNGTTEWALDSIAASEVLWMPWEHQLRDLLGERFQSLQRGASSYIVTLVDGSNTQADDPETAYALALLSGG